MIEKLKRLNEKFVDHFAKQIKVNLEHYRNSLASSLKRYPIPTFEEIFKDTAQVGADVTKAINPIILVIFFDILEEYSDIKIDRQEVTGLDCTLDFNPIEIKMTKANKTKKGIFVTTWTGNKSSDKVPKHILISYYLDFVSNQITHLFIGYIDLDDCDITSWDKTTSIKSQFSNLTVKSEDAENMHIIIGSKKVMRKNTHFFLQELKIC